MIDIEKNEAIVIALGVVGSFSSSLVLLTLLFVRPLQSNNRALLSLSHALSLFHAQTHTFSLFLSLSLSLSLYLYLKVSFDVQREIFRQLLSFMFFVWLYWFVGPLAGIPQI